MKSSHWSDKLLSLDVGEETIKWAKRYSSPQLAWQACQRGELMLDLLQKLPEMKKSSQQRKIVLMACGFARLSLNYAGKEERRPRIAIQMAEDWARKKRGVTIRDVGKAGTGAWEAFRDSEDHAAHATAHVAEAAYAAASACGSFDTSASYANDALWSSFDAADSVAHAGLYGDNASNKFSSMARKSRADVSVLSAQCANIIREFYPFIPDSEGWRKR